MAAPSAAHEPVELSHEDGPHCDIAANPCIVEAHGESHLSVMGFLVSSCESHFVAELGEDGTGHVTDVDLIDHPNSGVCTRIPCNGVGESPSEVEWDIANTRETAVNQVTMDRTFCIDASNNPNGTGMHCTAPITITETGTHQYAFSMGFTCPNGGRFESEWAAEGTSVEFEHAVPPGQEPVEVDRGDCQLETDPCVLDVHGESHLSIFGFIVSNCEEEFTTHIGADGSGHVVNAVLLDHSDGGDCTRAPCNGIGESADEVEWDMTAIEETWPNTGLANLNFCLDAQGNPSGTGTHCNAPVSLTEGPELHHYALSAAYTCPSGVRLEGTWEGEGAPLEVTHQ
ncbi:MAG TPA: hypothetical protein VHF88_02440 [Thermoleophilaceae bacterium]|nr:hypothetical protein [Thermoleophilaceae bacterium]